MENASKALLMAGGVLIGILLIVLLTRMLTNVGALQKANLTKEEEAQLVQFNEQYTKYINQYVYGQEVRSLMNKYESDGKVKVNVSNGIPPLTTGEDTQYYKCTNVGYDNQTGRVNSITFQKVEISSTE